MLEVLCKEKQGRLAMETEQSLLDGKIIADYMVASLASSDVPALGGAVAWLARLVQSVHAGFLHTLSACLD